MSHYHVVVTNDDTGVVSYLSRSPMSHYDASTMLRKCSIPRAKRFRLHLLEVQPFEPQSDHQREVYERINGRGMHYQLIAGCLLDRLLRDGQAVVSGDLYVRTPERHAEAFGNAPVEVFGT